MPESHDRSLAARSATARARRSLDRRARGEVVLQSVVLPRPTIDTLTELGWIPDGRRDRGTVADGFAKFCGQALAVGVRPPAIPTVTASAVEAPPPPQRRGKRDAVRSAMRADLAAGRLSPATLGNMLEKLLAHRYGCGRDVARQARAEVLAEVEGSAAQRDGTANGARRNGNERRHATAGALLS